MSVFHVTCSSDTKRPEGNKPQSFTNRLANRLQFSSDWQVGLVSFTFPPSWPTLGTHERQHISIVWRNGVRTLLHLPRARVVDARELATLINDYIRDEQYSYIAEDYTHPELWGRHTKRPVRSVPTSEPPAEPEVAAAAAAAREKRQLYQPSHPPPPPPSPHRKQQSPAPTMTKPQQQQQQAHKKRQREEEESEDEEEERRRKKKEKFDEVVTTPMVHFTPPEFQMIAYAAYPDTVIGGKPMDRKRWREEGYEKTHEHISFHFSPIDQRFVARINKEFIESVELGPQLTYTMGYEQALLNKATNYAKHLPDVTGGVNSLYIYAPDLIEPSLMGDSMAPVLRIINVGSPLMQERHEVDFGVGIQFHRLLHKEISEINILVCTEDGTPVPFDYGACRLVLQFKKVHYL